MGYVVGPVEPPLAPPNWLFCCTCFFLVTLAACWRPSIGIDRRPPAVSNAAGMPHDNHLPSGSYAIRVTGLTQRLAFFPLTFPLLAASALAQNPLFRVFCGFSSRISLAIIISIYNRVVQGYVPPFTFKKMCT